MTSLLTLSVTDADKTPLLVGVFSAALVGGTCGGCLHKGWWASHQPPDILSSYSIGKCSKNFDRKYNTTVLSIEIFTGEMNHHSAQSVIGMRGIRQITPKIAAPSNEIDARGITKLVAGVAVAAIAATAMVVTAAAVVVTVVTAAAATVMYGM